LNNQHFFEKINDAFAAANIPVINKSKGKGLKGKKDKVG
jgi:hypothetical protein